MCWRSANIFDYPVPEFVELLQPCLASLTFCVHGFLPRKVLSLPHRVFATHVLSCALGQGDACMYDRSIISVTRGLGRGFMPGLVRAVDETEMFSLGVSWTVVPFCRCSVSFPLLLFFSGFVSV